MKYDFLIVGAGFAGSVIAERAASKLNKKVLLVDKFDHIGGHCYDYFDENGILIHKFGPHAFHTKSKKVWDYLSRFTDWTPYYHRVLAAIDGMKVPVPFNFDSIYRAFPGDFAAKLERKLLERFSFGEKIPILKFKQVDDSDLRFLYDFIYEKIFLNYTQKQWDLKPDEIDPSVSGRVPVLLSRENRYFRDKYQAVPKFGYTELFRNLLAHRNIHILLKTNFKDIEDAVDYETLIFTGCIDEFFDYKFGALPYRSLGFEYETHRREYFQETAQVNYPNEYDFTRITEFKHFHGRKREATTIAYEYPQPHKIGINSPYYPIVKDENAALYAKYAAEAKKLARKALFVGRLAEYKYYNMDEIVLQALNVFENKIAEK